MLTLQEQQTIMFKLRCVAERDPEDLVANRASQLAYELEDSGRLQRLTDVDRQLIAYAFRKNYQPTRVGGVA